MIALAALILVSAALNTWQARRHSRAVRALAAERDAAYKDRDTVAAERDAALVERNTALLKPKWVVVPPAELARLAKTGCKECFGAGKIETQFNVRVCACVRKAMAKDNKYSVSDAGAPIRLANEDEAAEIDASRVPPLRLVQS